MPAGMAYTVRGAVAIPLSLPWVCCSSETALSPAESPLKKGQQLPLCVHTFPGKVACTHTLILTPQLPVTDANWLTSLSYREGGPWIDGRQV